MRSTPARNNEWPRSPQVSRLDSWPQRRSEDHQHEVNRRPTIRQPVPHDRRWRAHLPPARQEQPARAAGPSGTSTWPSSRSDNSRSRPWRASNHGRASIARQESSHDEAVQRPSQVWDHQPLRIQRSEDGNLLGDVTREATDEPRSQGRRAHQRHAHFDLGRSDEFDRMPQHLFSAADACDNIEYDQVEQHSSLTRRGSGHGAKSTGDNAVYMEGHESTTVNRAHEGRTQYIAQATRTHDSLAEAPRSPSPGLQVEANGVSEAIKTSSKHEQHVPGPQQSSLLRFYSRRPNKVAGNSSHENSNKVRQMDGSQLAVDATTGGALLNADTPSRRRRGSLCEIVARDIEIDDEMWDGDGDVYEDAEGKPESSALGKRKAKVSRVSRCDSGGAQGLKPTESRAARRGGSASTHRAEFPKEQETMKRNRRTQPCDLDEHVQVVYGGGHGQKMRSRKRCRYPEGCDKSAQRSTKFCVAHGGGKRCQYPEGCGKGAQGSTMFCAEHGGGKRCQYPEGCDKSAIGRTLFCLAHGGGNDVNIPKVVTRVLSVRQSFASPMVGVGDVNIPRVAARVLGARLCFAQNTAGASDVNIPRVVTRVQ
jgi:hypothetical protein